jgi:serine/threonine protein kinase
LHEGTWITTASEQPEGDKQVINTTIGARQGCPCGAFIFNIVYEYVPGRTCQEVLSKQQLEFGSTGSQVGKGWQREWIERIATLADALSYASDESLVHRDIKPANIMIDTRGRPQIMDFGLAKALTGGVAATGGGIAGTPAYMSPEQARGESQIGPSSDQYSLAAVLFEALTGEQTVRSSGIAAIVEISQRQSVLTAPLANFDHDLRVILTKAMSASPTDRYDDCATFASDLRHYLALEPIEGVRPSLWHRGHLWTRRNRSTLGQASPSLLSWWRSPPFRPPSTSGWLPSGRN